MDACKSAASSILALTASLALAQQPDPLTDFEITGRVYEPQPISPTEERVQQLQLPTGFALHRFVEGLENPRMLAVAYDGTVYVTQRRPGNLVMLKDVDRDGIVDAQQIVARIPQLHGIEIRGRTMYLVDVKRVYEADIKADGTLRVGLDGALYLSVGGRAAASLSLPDLRVGHDARIAERLQSPRPPESDGGTRPRKGHARRHVRTTTVTTRESQRT
jgi:hypothetical protein